MEMYLAMIERHQLNAANAYAYAAIARDLFDKAITRQGKAYHHTNWALAMRRAKREAANARHMVMELLNK